MPRRRKRLAKLQGEKRPQLGRKQEPKAKYGLPGGEPMKQTQLKQKQTDLDKVAKGKVKPVARIPLERAPSAPRPQLGRGPLDPRMDTILNRRRSRGKPGSAQQSKG